MRQPNGWAAIGGVLWRANGTGVWCALRQFRISACGSWWSGWYYLSTLDDFSRYIVAWKLCTIMAAADVTATLDLAPQALGLDQAACRPTATSAQRQRPVLCLPATCRMAREQGMRHTRGKPYHPMTQGKIERWHLSLKSRILLENYYLPGDLEHAVAAFVDHYNHLRYHESLDNLTPADVYFGRGARILANARGSSERPSQNDAYCIVRKPPDIPTDEPDLP